MSSYWRGLWAVVVLLLSTAVANSATVYVDAAATGAGNGSTWTDAFTTIQSAVSSAGSSDEVWVKSGMYFGTITLGAGDKVYGGFDGFETQREQRDIVRNPTTIHGNGGRAVTMGSRATIDGFIITGGSGTPGSLGSGSGVECSRYVSGTIENCTFTNNTGGAAVHGMQTGPEILLVRGCFFKDNDAGAIAYFARNNYGNNHQMTVDRCTFISNSVPGEGGAICIDYSYSWHKIFNSVFIGNRAYKGGGIATDPMGAAPTEVWNCTFYNNVSTSGVGHACYFPAHYQRDGGTLVQNSIFWGHDWSLIASPRASESTMTLDIGNSCLQNGLSSVEITGTKGTFVFTDLGGNIASDPRFYNEGELDVRLFRGSPCIDAGASNGPPEIVYDITGIERPMGDSYDIGAYEYLAPIPEGTLILLYGKWELF